MTGPTFDLSASASREAERPDALHLPGLDLWDASPEPPRHEVRILDTIHRMFDFNIDRTNTDSLRVLHLRALHLLDGQPMLLERRVMHDSLVFAAMGSSQRAFADPLGAWNAMPAIAVSRAKLSFNDTRAIPCPLEEAGLLAAEAGVPALVHRHEAADDGHQIFFTVEQWAVRMKQRTLEGKVYWDYLD
jgi:hypothetical protein